jgi:hypothetical protein
MSCIYCGIQLVPGTAPAHIISKCLGGRVTSRTSVCTPCNNSFTSIEDEACRRVAPNSAMAGGRRGDGSFVSAVIAHEGSEYRVQNTRMDELAGPPLERGRVHPMPARREDQVRTVVRALRSRGWGPEAMLDGRFRLERDADVPPVPEMQTDPIETIFRWCDRITKRAMVRSAIELIAFFEPEAARLPQLESVRRFARYDEGDHWAGVDTETTASGLEQVEALYIHGIDFWTAGAKLHYRMTLFSLLHFVGTLTESWSAGSMRGSYTLDIRAPAETAVVFDRSDGATLVGKSDRVRRRELDDALEQHETTSMANSERRRGRAPALDFNDLYPDVVAAMTNPRS